MLAGRRTGEGGKGRGWPGEGRWDGRVSGRSSNRSKEEQDVVAVVVVVGGHSYFPRFLSGALRLTRKRTATKNEVATR